MLTTLTVSGGREKPQTFRFFGIEGRRQAHALADKFKAQGYTVTLTERAL